MTKPSETPPGKIEDAPGTGTPDMPREAATAETAVESEADSASQNDPLAPEAVAERPAAEPPVAEPEPDDLAALADPEPGPGAIADPEPEAEPAAPQPQPLRESPQAPARRGGFLPALLGGVVAAGLGAGAVLYLLPEGWRPAGPDEDLAALGQQVQQQAGQIQAAEADIALLKDAATKADALSGQIDGLRHDLDGQVQGLNEQISALNSAQQAAVGRLDALEGRATALEQRPVEGGGASAAAVEGFQRELAQMRADLDAQQSAGSARQEELEAAAQAAEARIAAAEQEAARLQAESAETARKATARAALSHLQAALESGVALTPALNDLTASGVIVPEALTDQAEGVPTLAALEAAFPEAARAALQASLRVSSEGDGALSRFGAFLQAQTGARSLTPQEGSGPDAVLSRAEAQLKAGDLPAALAEVQGLPAEGQAAMADWQALAQRRIAAIDAVAAVAAAVN